MALINFVDYFAFRYLWFNKSGLNPKTKKSMEHQLTNAKRKIITLRLIILFKYSLTFLKL